MIKTIVACDVCGTEKKETNNWYNVLYNKELFRVAKDTRDTSRFNLKDICGAECLFKLLSQWLQQ